MYKLIEKQSLGARSRLVGTNLLEPIHCSGPYKLSFFPSAIRDWNNLDNEIRESKSKNIFKKRILNKIRPKKASYFGIRNHDHVRYLTMLRLDLSPLRDHKFRKGFLDTSNGQNISNILGYEMSTLPRRMLVNLLLYGREDTTAEKNNLILNNVIEYIIKSKRLDILEEGEVFF